MTTRTYGYTPIFLANALLGTRCTTMPYDDMVAPFFKKNYGLLRNNWRTGPQPADKMFGPGCKKEPTFKCLCLRELPICIAHVDHVATRTDLTTGNDPVRIDDIPQPYLTSPISKSVLVLLSPDGGLRSVRVTYHIRSFDQKLCPDGRASASAPSVSSVKVANQRGQVTRDEVFHGGLVTPGHKAFCIRAYCDSAPSKQYSWKRKAFHSRNDTDSWVGEGAIYFEYAAPRLTKDTMIHSIGLAGRHARGISMTFGELLVMDLTNLQLLCPLCNGQKNNTSFKKIAEKRPGEIFAGL